MSDVQVFLDSYGALRRVGTLRRYSGARRERVTYEHDPHWLTSSDAFQFDPTIPLTAGVIVPQAHKEMFGTLGDSAPDTWGRELMRRKERRQAELEGRPPRVLHETDYLLGVSDQTRLGAFRFKFDEGGEFQASNSGGVPTLIALGGLIEASHRIVSGDETDEDLRLVFASGSSLGGARPKASIFDQHGKLSIAKFPKETDHYSVSRWEAIALDMAKACGINTVDYDLVSTSHGLVFITPRFDRLGEQRIPFMSALAMTEHDDGDDDASYLEIVDAITNHGAHPAQDRAELFRRIAFNILINSTDDHLRNHGFLWAGRHGWQLSPCYDLNPAPAAARVLKTRINFDDATASLQLLQEVAEHFLRPADGLTIIRECGGVVRNWRDFAHRRQAPAAEIDRMVAAFEHDDLAYALRL